MISENNEFNVKETKQFRKDMDEVLQKIKNAGRTSRERSLSITKLQESIMWLGMDLKALGETTPYPNSYNAGNSIVEPTADNLTL